MASKKDVLDELKSLSSAISLQVRTTALGVLALVWGLMVGDSQVIQSISREGLVLVGLGCVLTLFFDYLQYCAGYWNTDKLRIKMEGDNSSEGQYEYRSLSYELRKRLFVVKQATLWLSVLLLIYVIADGLMT